MSGKLIQTDRAAGLLDQAERLLVLVGAEQSRIEAAELGGDPRTRDALVCSAVVLAAASVEAAAIDLWSQAALPDQRTEVGQ